MRGHKLKSDVNFQRALKQKGVKHTRVKQGLGVYVLISFNDAASS